MAAVLACLALAAAGQAPAWARPAVARPAPSPKLERAIRSCANRNRRVAGLVPLRGSGVLAKAARLQAHDMAAQGFFEHTDPQGRDPADRVAIFDRAHSFTLVGENIAAGYPSAASACNGWMNSAGHRANILDPEYTSIGAGFARGGPYGRYYVQVFARATGTASSRTIVDQVGLLPHVDMIGRYRGRLNSSQRGRAR